MAKVLLVDTNLASAPIAKALATAGHEVHVIGGNPEDYLAKTSPHYIQLDYSQQAELAALVDHEKFDYLVPGCNDRSYLMCAELAGSRGYPGMDSPEVTETINNKERFRAFANGINMPVPQVHAAETAPRDQPVIVKPVDAFSGRGVTILREFSEAQLQAAFEHARSVSRSRTCLVEDYVEGQLFSHSCFIRDKRVVAEFIVEEHGTANPFVVDTSRVVFDFPAGALARVRKSIEDMAQALKLVDGLIHTQFICQAEQFWIIEITRRCPGDLYSMLVELTTGMPYAAWYALPFTGQPLPALPELSAPRWIMRHTLSVPETTSLAALRFRRALQIECLLPLRLAGDEVLESPYGRIALLFVDAGSRQELDDLFAQTLARDLYSLNF
ncbi:acetyl-CoA carboxylase biotin carboxylase subunit family protein [Uliginosibacterium sp. TH139]|uniref:ATP-grasp domain-containing protein n=1 Tax=Uliginosibacterium sp. TH139 TaxID=2067453 RepID=UPI000C7B7263|nr:ATP-grasp domain-containing protein [Uliginosibacterium sp. TH139]PLK48670.1 hypothetical protein C0V76_11470 [Uliginosibacterium sp. TH139]